MDNLEIKLSRASNIPFASCYVYKTNPPVDIPECGKLSLDLWCSKNHNNIRISEYFFTINKTGFYKISFCVSSSVKREFGIFTNIEDEDNSLFFNFENGNGTIILKLYQNDNVCVKNMGGAFQTTGYSICLDYINFEGTQEIIR